MGILATPASFAAGWPWVLPPTGPSQQLCVRTKQRRRVKLPVHSKVAPRLPCASGRWAGACCPREGRLHSCLLRSLARRVRHGVQGGRPVGRRRLPGFFLSPWGCGGTPHPRPGERLCLAHVSLLLELVAYRQAVQALAREGFLPQAGWAGRNGSQAAALTPSLRSGATLGTEVCCGEEGEGSEVKFIHRKRCQRGEALPREETGQRV